MWPFNAEKSTVVLAAVSVDDAAVVAVSPAVATAPAAVVAVAAAVAGAAVALDELLSLPHAAAMIESEMMPATASRRLTVFTECFSLLFV